jgi:hypothetical protein
MDVVTARRFARRLPNLVEDRDYFPFGGGLNLVDTPLQVPPGELLACSNYECAMRGGYERIGGYERVDGREKPSDARYWILEFSRGDTNRYPPVGGFIYGAYSGASGTVIDTLDSTSPTGRLALRTVTGDFLANEPLVYILTFGYSDGSAVVGDAASDEDHERYTEIVTEYNRSLIEAVPGEGPIRGVAVYNGVMYAIRDNLGATAGVLHRAGPNGWEPIVPGERLFFTEGKISPAVGAVIEGLDSGALGVVRRIVVTSGDWTTHNANGYLILSDVSGSYYDDEDFVGGLATVDGTNQQINLPAGGKYEFRIHNFYGDEGRRRLYGVNGVGPAFEYQRDSEFLCPLETGMPNDAPDHLAVHKNQLWLSFPGGSVQKSGTGEPGDWTAISNSFELAVGDDVVGFLEEVGGALFVFSRQSTKYISGSESEGYKMDDFSFETGAYEWSIQRLGQGMYIDDRGFTTLAAAQDFGNFSGNSVSAKIDPLIQEMKNSVTCSVTARSKNRIRYMFADGRMLSVGFIGKKIAGFTSCDYGRTFTCAFSGEDASGNEMVLMGSDTGVVYQADSGTSFDGETIQAFARTAFHHSNTPSRFKRYRMAHVDVATRGPTTLRAAVDYTYSNPDSAGEPVKDISMRGGGGYWDVSRWNEFRWSAGAVANAAFKLEGSGTNISLLFSSESSSELPHTLTGVTFHLSMRRLNRST